MVKKFSKNGKSCEDYIKDFDKRMAVVIEKYPDLVQSVKVVYGCKFTDFLKKCGCQLE